MILHLARNIISCPLHISALLLYLKGSKKTLDLTPCLPNRPKGVAQHSESMGGTPPCSSVALILDCQPSSPTLPCFRGVVFFQMVAINSALDLYFFMRSQLSLPEFLTLLVSMPACALPMGSFNRNTNQTLSRLSKILISILIQSEIRHIFKSQQHLQVICAD